MKWTIAGLILVGIAASLSAALLAASLRAARAPDVVAAEADREILIATRDLPAMTVIDASAVSTQTVSAAEAPENSVSHAVQVVGQVLIAPLIEGQAFRTDYFAGAHSNMQLASALPEGFRAMTIQLVANNSGIEGLLYPGSMVDVVASFRLRRGGEAISAMLLQGVQVLAVGPRTIVNDGSRDGAAAIVEKQTRLVTLMVDPKQAEALQLAIVYGTVSLAMRNPLDDGVSHGSGLLMSELSEELGRRIAQIAEPNTSREVVAAEPYPSSGPPAGGTEAGGTRAGTQASVRPDVDAAFDPLMWTTVVLRGRIEETQEFPLDEEPNEDEQNQETPESPRDPD